MIKKDGEKWILYSKDGSKKLGTHDSEADAKKQEAAIEANKNRAAAADTYRTLVAGLDMTTLARKPDKGEHPFTYCKEVVVPAIEEKEGAMDDPDAFCGWWKGEHEYEAAEATKDARTVHLMGATGQIRTATFENKEYMVVPVIALMEGVIHAINADTPEFVPLACLSCAPQGWDGRPVVIGHPVKDGKQISANSPTVLESQAFGRVFGARIEGKKLMLEAWIDPAKAERVGAQDIVTKLRENRMCEVSVGAFVVTEKTGGMYGDKPYKAVWRDIVPDHLAFLPKGIGACSNEMGCGSPRSAMAHLMTADHIETLAFPFQKFQKKEDKGGDDWAAKADAADAAAAKAAKDGDDAEAAKQRKLAKDYRAKMKAAQYGDTPNQAASEEKAELIAYQTMRTLCDQMNESYDAVSEIVDELIADETDNPTQTPAEEDAETEVETARLESLQVLCMSMYSTLNALMSLTADCLQPEPPTAMDPRYMAGARHSSTDRQIIQRVHDHAVSLGADCSGMRAAETPRVDPSTQQPVSVPAEVRDMCTCNKTPKGAEMTKEQRTELIKTLCADKHSGFTEGDTKMLESATDERLDSFRVAAAARAKEVEKQTAPPPAAEVKAAEVKPITEDDFIKAAPESLKTLIARAQAQDAAHKTSLVADLKTAQSEYSESELAAMSIESLERLSRAIGHPLEQPTSYAGRGVPRAAAAPEKNVYANPPNPYEEGLKRLRAADGIPEPVAN